MPSDKAPTYLRSMLTLVQPFDLHQVADACGMTSAQACARLHMYVRRGLLTRNYGMSPIGYRLTDAGRLLAAGAPPPKPQAEKRPAPAPTPPAPISPERAAIRDLQRELSATETERDQLRRRVADLEHRLARAPGAGGPARLAGLRP